MNWYPQLLTTTMLVCEHKSVSLEPTYKYLIANEGVYNIDTYNIQYITIASVYSIGTYTIGV